MNHPIEGEILLEELIGPHSPHKVKMICEMTTAWYTVPMSISCRSPQIAQVLGEDPMAMAAAVRAPQLLLPAGNDDTTYKSGGDLFALLEKIPEIGPSMGTRSYEDMVHGWSIRGDMSDVDRKSVV